jgi:hypothetical protein
VVAVPDRIRQRRGITANRRRPTSNNPSLFDGNNLDLVVGEDDAIGDRLPDQSARDEAGALLLRPEGDREADLGAMRRARRYPQAPAVGFDN